MGCLTVYTDASYSTHSRIAGYGFWARDRKFITQGRGAEPDICCNTYAEIRAIAYALYRLEKEHVESVKNKKYCSVTTDSLTALEYYKLGKVPKGFSRSPLNYVNEFIRRFNLVLTVNHIQAHRSCANPRFFVNNKVDQLARTAREQAEEKKLCLKNTEN